MKTSLESKQTKRDLAPSADGVPGRALCLQYGSQNSHRPSDDPIGRELRQEQKRRVSEDTRRSLAPNRRQRGL